MCKTLAKAQYFAIINVQNVFSCLDIIDAITDRQYSKNPARRTLLLVSNGPIIYYHVSYQSLFQVDKKG